MFFLVVVFSLTEFSFAGDNRIENDHDAKWGYQIDRWVK